MSSRDHYKIALVCPSCAKIGTVHFSELDGYSYMSDRTTRLEEITEGFVAERPPGNKEDYVVRCEACDVGVPI